MERRPFRDYLMYSINTQLIIWLNENTWFPQIKIVIGYELRSQLRAECTDVCVVHDDSVQETFCGYPLVLDKNMPDDKFELRFLTCNQVRKRVTLTG